MSYHVKAMLIVSGEMMIGALLDASHDPLCKIIHPGHVVRSTDRTVTICYGICRQVYQLPIRAIPTSDQIGYE